MPLAHEQKAARDTFAKLGEAATYTPPGGVAASVSNGVVLDRDLELFLDPVNPTVSQRRTVLWVLVEDVAEPVRGGVFVVGADTFKVESRLSYDGIKTGCVVR